MISVCLMADQTLVRQGIRALRELRGSMRVAAGFSAISAWRNENNWRVKAVTVVSDSDLRATM